MNKAKAHTRYRNKDNLIVPGVTTVLNILNKPALVKWANNLGLQGIDSSKYVSETAQIGTLAHYIIECHIKQVEPDLSDYSQTQIDQASNAVIKFFDWEEENNPGYILSELPLVSDKYQFGGTIDCYCILNDKHTLLDFKTSKALYSEHKTQVCAYAVLLVENGYQLDDVRILRIGRDEEEGFEDHKVGKRTTRWKLFKHCLEIYRLNKVLK